MPKVRQRNAHEHNHFRKALEEIPRVRKLQLQQQEGGTKEMIDQCADNDCKNIATVSVSYLGQKVCQNCYANLTWKE